MTNQETADKLDLLINMVQNQGKQISHLMNTIKAYQKKELNMEESAAHLGIEVSTLRNLCSSRKLIGFKKRKFRYFNIAELEDYLARQ